MQMPANLVIVASQVMVAAFPHSVADGEVPEWVPFQLEASDAPTSDFAL